MNDDKSAEIFDFLRTWREADGTRLGRIEERLDRIEEAMRQDRRRRLGAELEALHAALKEP